MPFYELVCEKCGHEWDHMTSMAARDEKVACPECGSKKTQRKLSMVGVQAEKEKSSNRGPAPAHGGGCGCCSQKPRGCPMQR